MERENRIGKYGFIENQDFEVFNKFGENPQGGAVNAEAFGLEEYQK